MGNDFQALHGLLEEPRPDYSGSFTSFRLRPTLLRLRTDATDPKSLEAILPIHLAL